MARARTISAYPFTMGMKRIALTCCLAIFAVGCAHKPEDFSTDVTAAEQKCTDRHLATVKFRCFSAEESAVVKRDIPFATNAFSDFVDTRAAAAQLFDNETEGAIAAASEWQHDLQIQNTMLTAQEPRWGQSDSQLSRDALALKLDNVCGSAQLGAEKWATCSISLLRPVAERDANDTISFFQRWSENVLAISKKYDAIALPAISNAQQKFTAVVNQATKEFYASAQRAEQAEIAKEQADKAQAQAQAAQNLKALGDFVGNLAELTLAGAVVYEAARAPAYAPASQPSAPTSLRCTSNTIYSTTYTNCYGN